MKRYILTALVILFLVKQSNAQSFADILNISHSVYSNTGNKFSDSPIKQNHLQISKIYLAGPPIPIIKDKLTYIYNMEYKLYRNKFTNHAELGYNLLEDNLHDVKWSSILNWRFKPKWALNYVNNIVLRGDFKEFEFKRSYFNINAFTLTIHPNADNNFRLGLGVVRARDLGEVRILPTAVLFYKTDKWLIDLIYPRLNVFYKPMKRLETGLLANFDAGYFPVKFDENVVSDWERKPEYQKVLNLSVTPVLSYYIKDNINIYAKAGLAILSIQGLADKHFEKIENNEFKTSSMNFTFGAGLTIRVPHH